MMIKHLQNPGVYFALMWWWIIVPFFVLDLITNPIPTYFSSYIRYFGAFLVIGASGMTIGLLNAKTNFWSRFGHWRRFFVLIGAYTISTFLVLGNSGLMVTYMSAEFFGHGNDSSFEMICITSATFYFAVGTLLSIMFSIAKRIKKGNRTR